MCSARFAGVGTSRVCPVQRARHERFASTARGVQHKQHDDVWELARCCVFVTVSTNWHKRHSEDCSSSETFFSRDSSEQTNCTRCYVFVTVSTNWRKRHSEDCSSSETFFSRGSSEQTNCTRCYVFVTVSTNWHKRHSEDCSSSETFFSRGSSEQTNCRPECPHYDACANFVDAMQHRHKHVTPGEFPNNIMLFGKNVCAAGSTSGNIQCGMDSTESVTLTGDLFCDGATTSPFIIMQGPDAILDCNGYKIFGSNVERRGIAVRLTNGASAIN